MSIPRRTVDMVLDLLNEAGLKAYLYHHRCGGSAYIKFRESVGGSLRISDHPQRARYYYRWNLRLDYVKRAVKENDNGSAYYYPITAKAAMIEDMLLYRSLMAAELS